MIYIILFIFIFLLIHYIIFLLSIYRGLDQLNISDNNVLSEKISIIIPFRNESNKIVSNLKSIESQTYPKNKFEVVYVNDGSKDDSALKIEKFKSSGNIRVINLPQEDVERGHKKRAVSFGIENCSGEIIVTSDADCEYESDWLTSILGTIDSDTAFVAGPVQFKSNDSLFSKLQKLEFESLIITGAGLIGSNNPVICNGANLAFRKNYFKAADGYENNLNLSSGDDGFLMQKISKLTSKKIKFCINKNSIVTTESNRTLSEFYEQRKRWASKGLFYENKFFILKLILIYLFYFGLIFQIAAGLFIDSYFLISACAVLVVKIIFEYNILIKGCDLLFNKVNIKIFLLAEIFHIPYIIISGLAGVFGGLSWKGRKVKR